MRAGLFCLMMLFSCSAHAKDLGTHGSIFEIAEESLLEVITKRLKASEKEGKIDAINKKIASQMVSKMKRPTPVPNLVNATIHKRHIFDPSIRVGQDFSDTKGVVFAKQGTTLNPLDHVSLRVPLLFLDGDNKDHVAWAKTQNPKSKWILTKGSPFELQETLQRQVFFDQAGVLTKRLGFAAVPCRVTQEGRLLVVEEIPLKRER